MVALRLIRLIETHSNEIARILATRIQTSPKTSQLQKVPESELLTGLQELLLHMSEWLLSKTENDIEQRYHQLAARRAFQGIALADSCWAVVMTKEYLWDFIQKQGFFRNPIELYGEMELLALVDQFFDRALCYLAEGYPQSHASPEIAAPRKKQREFNAAAFVP
jgi:hypothetical protein